MSSRDGVSVETQETHDEVSVDTQEEEPCCSRCSFNVCRTKCNQLPENATRRQRLRYAFMCPVHGRVGRYMSICLLSAFIYAALWSVADDDALPGGNIFGLCVLIAFCSLAGVLIEKIRLPRLLGMLIGGFILRNVPFIDVAKNINEHWSSTIRTMALTVIMIRAGLGLDPVALRKLFFGVLRLALLPCLVEATIDAVVSHYLLNFSWNWGFMLGFVLAAVSPAVVVPSVLALQASGYGTDKGIPTLIIAAASIENVLAITGFGIVLGVTFSKGHLVWTIVKGPVEIIVGILYGIVFGIVLWYIPHDEHTYKNIYRFTLLIAAGVFATFGSHLADIGGAGPLGCLALAFVIAIRWKKQVGPEVEHDQPCQIPVYVGYLWAVFEPLLFGLVGAEVDLKLIQPSTVGYGIAVLFIGLTLRLLVAFCVVVRLGLTIREQFFIPLAWFPKATVQAAIGSVALDAARAHSAPPDVVALGVQILTIAVLSIVITAPIGAIAIALSGPVLLNKPSAVAAAADETAVDDVELSSEHSTSPEVDERQDHSSAFK